MKAIKRTTIILALLSLAPALQALAEKSPIDSSPEINAITFTLNGKSKVNLKLSEGLTISTSGNLIKIDNNDSHSSFELQNVHGFSYCHVNFDDSSVEFPQIEMVRNNLIITGMGALEYYIYDLHGKKLYSGTFTGEGIIPTDFLTRGIYVIRINDFSIKFRK